MRSPDIIILADWALKPITYLSQSRLNHHAAVNADESVSERERDWPWKR